MEHFSAKSPALNCTVSINNGDPKVCMASLDGDTLGPPIGINITTLPEEDYDSGTSNLS